MRLLIGTIDGEYEFSERAAKVLSITYEFDEFNNLIVTTPDSEPVFQTFNERYWTYARYEPEIETIEQQRAQAA